MQIHSPREITGLLVAWTNGDESALEHLTPLVYEELHRLAHHFMRQERSGHTLQSTALFARSRKFRKRGGSAQRLDLDEAAIVGVKKDADLVALDEALDLLAKLDARQAKVVELRFFWRIEY